MADLISKLLGLILWVTEVLVALVVGLAMVNGKLSAEAIGVPLTITVIAGWIVVGLTLLGAVLTVVKVLTR